MKPLSTVFLTLLLLMAAHALAIDLDTMPKNLFGHWKLIGMECKSGALAPYGMSQNKWIQSKAGEQYLIISQDKVEQDVIEHGNAKKYCKTVYTGRWGARKGTIIKPRLDFQSRDGIGGYKCYPVQMPRVSIADRDWPYVVQNGVLKITHKDVAINMEKGKPAAHFCQSGSDMTMNYKLEK